ELHQYTTAATDLFGQWSPWSPAWLSLGPADVLTPAVASVNVKPFPGPGNTEPCSLTVTTEVVWDWTERSALSMQIAVNIYDPPPPPATIPEPTAPIGLVPTAMVFFDPVGAPSSPTPGVTVLAISDDGKEIFPGAHPSFTGLRRFRILMAGIPVTYGPALEK